MKTVRAAVPELLIQVLRGVCLLSLKDALTLTSLKIFAIEKPEGELYYRQEARAGQEGELRVAEG